LGVRVDRIVNLQLHLKVKGYMRIGHLAAITGLSASRIRFYEGRGLLPAAPRSANGYRDYPESAVGTLSFIERAQSLGFALKDLEGALPRAVEKGLETGEALRALEDKLAEVETHIAALVELRARLLGLIAEEKACLPSDGAKSGP
jgi:DNA-binding transcriptional MerR regulator